MQTSNSIRETWKELNAVLQERQRRGPGIESANPSPLWQHVKRHLERARTFIAISNVYLEGHKAIRTGQANVSSELDSWIKSTDPNEGDLALASMYAVAHCAALEGFMRAFASDWLNDNRLQQIGQFEHVTKKKKRETLPSALDAARDKLDLWVRPSGGSGYTEWIRVVECVFGCTLEECVKSTLGELVGFRHSVVHPEDNGNSPQVAPFDAHRFTAWGHACIAMATGVAQSAIPT